MKKTISLILAAVVLLTMLAACGGKAPVEPAETALYGKVTMENAPANALGTVVYLGYYESADAMKAELPEALERPATGRDGRWRSLCHHSAV